MDGANRVELLHLPQAQSYWLCAERFGPDNRQSARKWMQVTPYVAGRFRDDARAVFRSAQEHIELQPFDTRWRIIGAWFPAPDESWGPVTNPGGGPLSTEVLAYIGSSNPE